jgi:hypothetical protein
MGFLHKLRDPESDLSLARRMRQRRFAFFRSLVDPLPKPLRILDVGGTQDFWESMEYVDPALATITIVNLQAPASRHANVETRDGNACAMPEYADGQFDVVFSNSVIEHVGGLPEQQAMAREIQRIGRRYFVQTPNLLFPIEPHFLFPFFQFLPLGARAWLLMHLNLSWGGRAPDREAALATARGVQLLSGAQFRGMFPGARLYRERVLGLTKSFVAYAGWD